MNARRTALKLVIRSLSRPALRRNALASSQVSRKYGTHNLSTGSGRSSTTQVCRFATSPQPNPSKDLQEKKDDEDQDSAEAERRGAIGGFMRGLVGGNEVAAEDMYTAEAKKQGREIPEPQMSRESRLVAVKRRRRREEDNEERKDAEQTIRDRLFSRFAGSAFMKGAFEAKEKISESIEESDNPVINFFRNIYDKLFAENEMGQVIREIRQEDAEFNISDFVQNVQKELIPKILRAYLEGNRTSLKKICTEDAYRMLNASIRERQTGGIVMDTNILDIDDVELTAARFLEDSPVLIVSFSTQQINCLRNTEGVVIEGAEDDIRAVYYIWAFIREPELEEGSSWANEDEEQQSDSEKSETDSEASSSSTSNSENEAETAEKSGEAKLPPWKMMEMVIRGAHSTI
eukprot:Plantae.Rhodophyta-Hildenbrandia_rubra.ctg22095.p1 GENE.Plantae.Rhodophyta-Hildenbrandia_rubra.ctg22095~~Plantae.Rhodophyta-Hildenbrandia_rubra.ctg22095.p1  ORF type:complete len:412 (-),score=84.96 Plantae.Rhodophyta-Hildenbrandia_rubra.ctg22095:1587-2798(-)